jgi:hypothetical protein
VRGSIEAQGMTAEFQIMPDGSVRLSLIHASGNAITARFESGPAVPDESADSDGFQWHAAPAA